MGFQTAPPFVPLNGDVPIKGSNTFFEWAWVYKPFTAGQYPGPHKHAFNELFVWFGSDPEKPRDLGGEVEFWMGEGEDLETIKFNTSTLIFIPRGTMHLPLVYREVTRPILRMTIGCNSGSWAGDVKGQQLSSV